MKLLGIGQRDEYQYFIFRKEQKLLKILRKILLELGEEEDSVDDLIYQGGLCTIQESKSNNKKLKEKSILEILDQRFNFSGNGYNLDILFGSKKVFLIGYGKKIRSAVLKSIK